MLTVATAWLVVRLPAAVQQVLAAPAPTPTPPAGPGGFDWSRVHPDGSAIPKSGIFYTIMNAVMWLGGVAAFCGLVAGAIAFGVGPIFGAHIVSDRGKSMMWRNGLVAIIVGSATAIIAGLLVL
ncbi:hypothetical protein GCM10020358_49440 [Amorphoplanes nipponensis]|uniref:DUF4190 domain-containing protein n=1 Tax=Actinoplanes nipponensis TaxID=135950 RepID=A0A919JPV4_9ACTN|nr:hypothetical protein [Actinoplanes nipponensis]GIE53131.1 hypothetical protein Ani05nite_66650 [Actinoplanes nipponensis]